MPLIAHMNPALGTTNLKGFLGGIVDPANTANTVYRVPTRNGLLDFNNKAAHYNKELLKAWILENIGSATTADPLIVTAHSAGGQHVLKMLREDGAFLIANAVDPNKIRFWLAGCPEQPYTGVCTLWPTLDKPVYPGNTPHTSDCPTPPAFHGGAGVGFGPPPSNPWKITFIANEWDGWAHAPAGYASVPSMDESVSFFGIQLRAPWFKPGNITSRMRQKEGYHSGNDHYQDDPFSASTKKATYVDGNITYIYIMKYPIPYAVPQKANRYKARAIDEEIRPLWKAAYTTMPGGIVIPNPDYRNLPGLTPWRPHR